jgi:tetratricopeptide (TPR) repeat protein
LHSLGYIHAALGNHAEAVTCYEQSAELSRRMEDRFNEADTLASLGDLHQHTGNSRAARRAWARAVRILDEIGHPDANVVRVKLGPQRRLTVVH